MTDPSPPGRGPEARPTPRWRGALFVGLFALAVVAAALVHPWRATAAHPGPVSRSSTVAFGADGKTLWVTSPDDDSVVEVGRTSLQLQRRLHVAGQPDELTRLGSRLVVTRAQAPAVTVIDLAAPTPAAASVALPCGWGRSVVAVPAGAGRLAHDTAFVTCPTDDRVAVVDLTTGTTVAELEVGGRPTGIVSDGRSLTVSSAVGGTMHTWSLADLARALGPHPAAVAGVPRRLDVAPVSHRVWTDGDRSASSLGSLDVGGAGTVGVYQVVDNLRTVSAADLADGEGGYGKPLHGRARIEPALAGRCGARFASFTDSGRALSGPVAVAASPRGDLVWVVGQFSHSVSVVRCRKGAPAGTSTMVAAFPWVPVRGGSRWPTAGARRTSTSGSTTPSTAWSSPPSSRPTAAARWRRPRPRRSRRRAATDLHLSPVAEAGRRMFTDATDPHLTPDGVVTCASCHPAGGGDDGLVWRIQTASIPRKLRRTPDVWALDRTHKPLHWDGSLHSPSALVSQTVQELLGGDGLLVDPTPIVEYLHELPPPPGAPSPTAARTAVARGSALFHSAAIGCASCHTGATGTDGKRHDVLSPSVSPDARLAAVVTPTLLGVRGRGPYFHDGRAATLFDVLARSADRHGRTSTLTPRQTRRPGRLPRHPLTAVTGNAAGPGRSDLGPAHCVWLGGEDSNPQ